MHTCTHTHLHSHPHTYTHTCIHTRAHTYMHAGTLAHTCAQALMHTCMLKPHSRVAGHSRMRTRSISNNRKDNKRMGEREEQSEGSQDRRGRNGQAGKEGQRERLATLDSAFPLSCPSGGAVGGPLCTLVLEVLTWPGKGKGGLCAQLGCSERGACQGRRGLCWSLGGLATAGWPRCLHQGKGGDDMSWNTEGCCGLWSGKTGL